MKQIQTLFILTIALITVLLGFCAKSEDPSPIIAQVGKTRLTLENVKSAVPDLSDIQISHLQLENYVHRWIESELIYQEALRRGIHEKPEVKQRLRELEKDYVVFYFTEELIDKRITVSDSEFESYYQENSSEFLLQEDEYHLQLILVENLAEANRIRRRLLNGEDFVVLAQTLSIDGSSDLGGDIGFIRLRDISTALSNAIVRLRVGQLSRVIRSEVGYHIIKVLEHRRRGEVKTLDEVKEIIVQRVNARKRELEYRKFIAELSSKVDMKTNLQLLQTEQ